MSRSEAVHDGTSFRGGPLIPIFFFIAPLLTAIVPRLGPFLLLILALVLIVAALHRGLSLRALLEPNPAMIALAAVAAYAMLSAIWAAEPGEALSKGGILLAAVLAVFAAASAIHSLDGAQRRHATLAFLAGALCAALFLTIELVTAGVLTRAAMNAIPALQPDNMKRVWIVDGRVTNIELAEFNQHVGVAALQLWPGLLALSTWPDPRRTLLSVLFVVALAVPIGLSQHDSSQIGLAASMLILPFAWFNARAVIRGLALVWCLGFALVLPLDILAYKAELHLADWLPRSARARIIIWEYTAERVLERPLLGVGADSTPGAKAEAAKRPEQPEGFVQPRTTGHHAHDIFLQSWYELGLVGAVLMAIAGAAVILRMLLLPRPAQPFAAAAFTLLAVIAAFAWGMWQTWLLCAVGLFALYLLMAASLYQTPERGGKGPNAGSGP
jgi:O-antigen ligase